MTLEELKAQLDEALAEAAAEKIRADNAEDELKRAKERADGLDGQLSAKSSELEALKKERLDVDVEKLQKEVRNLTIMLNNEKKKRLDAEDPKRLREAVRERVKLEREALTVLGENFRFDDLDDRQIRVAVIERLDGPVDESRSDAYVVGKFDTLVEGHADAQSVIRQVQERVTARAEEKERQRADNLSARERWLKERDEAWTQTHTK